MKIGMPTLIELPSILDNLELCYEIGCDFLEVNLSFPFEFDEAIINEINQVKDKYGIELTFHFPENIDFAHNNEILRKSFLDYFDYVLELSKKLGIKLINMHLEPGIHINLPTKKVRIYEEYNDMYIRNIDSSLKYMLEKCNINNIRLCVENTKMFPYMLDTVLRFNNCGGFLTLDVGHDSSAKDMFREFIDSNNLNVLHMHLHDEKNGKNHLELYSGSLDIDELINYAKNNDLSVVVEVKTVDSLTRSISKIKKRI
ncbi:TIM barrel protein [Mycoplasmatota bacterium WC44]